MKKKVRFARFFFFFTFLSLSVKGPALLGEVLVAAFTHSMSIFRFGMLLPNHWHLFAEMG